MDYLRRVIAGVPVEGPGFRWTDILAALRVVAGDGSEDAVALLRRMLDFDGELMLDEESSLPHSMSPEDMLRSLALQALAKRDREKHRDAIKRVAESPECSEHLRGIAYKLLA